VLDLVIIWIDQEWHDVCTALILERWEVKKDEEQRSRNSAYAFLCIHVQTDIDFKIFRLIPAQLNERTLGDGIAHALLFFMEEARIN